MLRVPFWREGNNVSTDINTVMDVYARNNPNQTLLAHKERAVFTAGGRCNCCGLAKPSRILTSAHPLQASELPDRGGEGGGADGASVAGGRSAERVAACVEVSPAAP